MAITLYSLLLIACLAIEVKGHVVGRIAGGYEVRDRCQAPYNAMVSLEVRMADTSAIICSAVMIHDQHLLTTAHCLYSFLNLTGTVRAVVGQKDMYATDPYEQVIDIDGFKVHTRYSERDGANNIGIIRLARKAGLNPCVQVAKPMTKDPKAYEDVDDSCRMMGWGSFYDSNRPTNSRLLRQAPVRVWGQMPSNIISMKAFKFARPQGTLMADGATNAMKACQFDVGGMVSCERNGQQVLRGLIGDANCNMGAEVPIYVTDVSVYRNWIRNCLGNWETCSSL